MKKILAYIGVFVAILGLAILFVNERQDRIDFQNESIKWENIALKEQNVPSVDKKAQEFVKALNEGNHKDMLTGAALEEYEMVLEDDSEFHEDGEEGHEHEEVDIDTSLQNTNILLSSTKTTEEGLSSEVLYQVSYKGFFDNADTGMVDQRILTIVMDIDWEKSGNDHMVEKYSVQLIDDNIDDVISGDAKGSEPNDESTPEKNG